MCRTKLQPAPRFWLRTVVLIISLGTFALGAQEPAITNGMIEPEREYDAVARIAESQSAAFEQVEALSHANTSLSTQGPINIPELISPAEGAVLDNGRTDFLDLIVWDFDWTDVSGATQYNLYVIGARASSPAINIVVSASSYHFEAIAYIIEANRFGWTWKVRAMSNGVWGSFSATRSFDVELLNTDPPFIITPQLILPADGDVLDNGRMDFLDLIVWDFDWSDVPQATQFNLYVIGARAQMPVIDVVVSASCYHHEAAAYIIEGNRYGWTWKVRAKVNGIWGAFSAPRTFDVEPVNTDPPGLGRMTSAHANLPAASRAAQSWSADAKLVMMGTHQSSLTPTGVAAMWFFLFHSASLDSAQAVLLSNGNVLGQVPIWHPPSEVALPNNCIDSPLAASKAEARGGNEYRAMNQNVSVFASLSRGFLQRDSRCALWKFDYISSTSSALTIFVDAITGIIVEVEERTSPHEIPGDYTLRQNYPNPFNPTTTIEFALPKTSLVTLKIYNLLGEEVATLVSEKLPAGRYARVWEAKGLASGVYVYRLATSDFVQTKKLTLLR